MVYQERINPKVKADPSSEQVADPYSDTYVYLYRFAVFSRAALGLGMIASMFVFMTNARNGELSSSAALPDSLAREVSMEDSTATARDTLEIRIALDDTLAANGLGLDLVRRTQENYLR
ncbi:MAG: hypothetical protein ABIA93_00640 [Candidatus Woesearchaeota archaeon]